MLKNLILKGKELAIIQEAVPGEDYCSTYLFEHGKITCVYDLS